MRQLDKLVDKVLSDTALGTKEDRQDIEKIALAEGKQKFYEKVREIAQKRGIS